MRHPARPPTRAYLASAMLGLLGAGACAPSVPPAELTALPASRSGEVMALPEPNPVTREEYAARRAALAATMEDGVFVAFGSGEPELDYLPYAQNSRFRYLTGVLEPDAGLILVKSGDRVEETLFVRSRNPARELWEGSRLGPEGAQRLTGIPSRTSDQLVPTLSSLLAAHGTLYVLVPPLPDIAREETLSREQQILRRVVEANPETRVVSAAQALQRLRARKSPAELDMIRRATLVSALAHREAMRSAQPGMNEFEIHGLVEYIFRRHGAERPAYSSIVGSGPNSTTLHYRSADRYMAAGELLLMDFAASYRGYASDITRTVPVDGRFTPDQRAIYDIVLAALKAAEAEIRVGARWADLNGAANRVIADGLARLGLIDSPEATYYCESPQVNNQCPQYRIFYMHGLGHGVGLDVHDPDISSFESFQPGSAFTVEPGVYVRADALDFLRDSPENRAMISRLRPAVARYRDIGVRIEDVFIVMEGGVDRVSRDVPREADDVETLMREPGLGQVGRSPDIVEWYRATTPR